MLVILKFCQGKYSILVPMSTKITEILSLSAFSTIHARLEEPQDTCKQNNDYILRRLSRIQIIFWQQLKASSMKTVSNAKQAKKPITMLTEA